MQSESPDSPSPFADGAWWDEPAPADDVDLDSERVTAVLVTHQAAAWLPQTLASLRDLDLGPDRLIAIDNDSTDATSDLLADALDEGLLDAAYSGERSWGFGQAVAAALDADIAEAAAPAPAGRRGAVRERRDWLWLLHDDMVVRPDTLQRLLERVAGETDIAVAGPKLLAHTRGEKHPRLLELGASIAPTGRRELGLEPGEIDQGQRDRTERVLGVSTCGMLVRRDVWDALDGLDPALPIFRDGVEFGWRANRAGHRVVTAPEAEVLHRQVGRAGLREHAASGTDPDRVDRTLGMRAVAAHQPGLGTWVLLVLGGLLRALGFALGKAGRRSLAELGSVRDLLSSRTEIAAMRQRIARVPAADDAADRVQTLRPGIGSSLVLAGEGAIGGVGDAIRRLSERPDDPLESDDTSLDELTGDDFAAREDHQHRLWHSPLLVGGTLAVLLAIVAGRRIWRAGTLRASELLPPAHSLGGAFESYLAPITGSTAWAAPWIGLDALGSTLAFGRADWWHTLLLALAVPLALVSAFCALRPWLGDRWLRVLVAGIWALLPALLGAVGRGSIGIAGLAVALPLLAWSLHRLARAGNRSAASRGVGSVAACGVIVASLQPLLGVLLLIGALVGAAMHPSRRVAWIVAGVLPWIVLSPWVPTLLRWPGRLLTGTEPALASVASATPWLLFAVLTPGWIGAVLAAVLRPRESVVTVALITAAVAFVLAVTTSKALVRVPPADDLARPDPTGWTLLAAGALLLATSRALDALAPLTRLGRVPRWVARTVTVLLVAAVAAGSAWWVMGGTGGLHRSADPLAPYVRRAQLPPQNLRVLMLDLRPDGAHWSLHADGVPTVGSSERGFVTGGDLEQRAAVEGVVARLASGTSDASIGRDLADLGIGYVWVRGATPDQETGIENAPGMGVGIDDRGATVWATPAADRLTGPATTEAGGVRIGIGIVQLAALVALIGMALPAIRRLEVRDPAAAARRRVEAAA